MEDAEEGQQCHELASPSSPQTPEELWARWKEAAEEAPQPESLRWEEGAACVCVCVGGVSLSKATIPKSGGREGSSLVAVSCVVAGDPLQRIAPPTGKTFYSHTDPHTDVFCAFPALGR